MYYIISEQQRRLSGCSDAHAYLRLRSSHMVLDRFSHDVAELILGIHFLMTMILKTILQMHWYWLSHRNLHFHSSFAGSPDFFKTMRFLSGEIMPFLFVLAKIWRKTYEPRHDKNQQNECAPSEDSDQPGRPPSPTGVFVLRSVGS